ncbi:TetR family transcriptional regulator [Rhodococcoides trifolii]|uniref:TetR family transcriptional regulator n=1 Tax=Rhodococcoides trifolii TaxID=908250 RepID=A0A917D248_9NOCA|nr:TetR family transcriptional regulator [Rhodococcus trifolii]GGG09407.1 TetR family transcriptional regulator [Rhodococcus trifolii]
MPPRTRSAATTRAAILDAARIRFGADGFERTTVRAIAADVGVDPAMVMRYFGTKDALFADAASFELPIPDLTGVTADDIADILMPRFFAVWEDDASFLSLLRATTTSSRAVEEMLGVFERQVAPALATVAVDNPTERAALVGSQILGLAFARYVLRVPPLVDMSREDLTAWIGPTLRRYLNEPTPVGSVAPDR